MHRRPITHLLLVAALVPIVTACLFVSVHGQAVPFWDEWVEPVDNAIKTAEGTLTFADLFRQYNDSRPVFTNLLTVVSVRLFDWDLKTEMFFNLFLAALTLALLHLILRRHAERLAIYLLPLFSLLVFSLTQRRSLLWAIQSQYYFLILFIVAALWALERSPLQWRSLWIAAICSVFATFSFANGFLVWFCLAPVLWMLGYRQRAHLLFWLAAGIACLTLFFAGYSFHPPGDGHFPGTLSAGKFAFAFVGNALFGHHGPTTPMRFALIASVGAAGVILLAVNIAFLRRRLGTCSGSAVWIGLAIFVLASSGAAALGRSMTEGLESALANRYVTLSLVFWIALLGLGTDAVREALGSFKSSRTARALVATNIAIGVSLILSLLLSNIRSLSIAPRVTPAHRACLAAAPTTRYVECLYGLHPVFDPETPSYEFRSQALDKIDRLAALKLGVFADGTTRD